MQKVKGQLEQMPNAPMLAKLSNEIDYIREQKRRLNQRDTSVFFIHRLGND